MNTEFISKHKTAFANAGTGLSAAAVVWIFATFTNDREFGRHCSSERESRSKQWQKIADLELEVEKVKMKVNLP